ncbi:hypothetical protein [Clostridium cadaveris]|uniref:hypothetical protein n=1 Tax=Clostridium cadaveris TaxID=1529 RepID=UPI0015B544D6|nr:hypothetical protein [Clostridium cadaveris]NWK11763.1 hypothetical protein [Clostridium cadaveris]
MIDENEATVICKKAIDTYGQAMQSIVAMEEASELVQAISKGLREKEHNIEEEIADVEIMCMQLRIMHNSKMVDKIKQQKLHRLKGMVW